MRPSRKLILRRMGISLSILVPSEVFLEFAMRAPLTSNQFMIKELIRAVLFITAVTVPIVLEKIEMTRKGL